MLQLALDALIMARDTEEQRQRKHEKYAAAIREARGLMTFAADRLGISRQALHKYVNAHPKMREALAEARMRVLDVAERNLFEKLDSGDVQVSQYILGRLGKDRGYGEKVEQSGTVEVVFRHVKAEVPADD